ncbi:glutathionylspermidine synthase family protein [Bacillus solitudinis]|uniref:glutathionylspermidine synthase family protein n=1 Tax=Bacillus solitudinis TaxID=2014074 RepID=UPI000C23376B|nr:glutathionylspermidine synthase family protein [Bacillus solitudinis]
MLTNRTLYKRNRLEFYSQFQEFWYDLNGEYSLYHLLEVEKELIQEIRIATKKMGDIFFKTSTLLRQLPDKTLIELGFPKESVPFLRFKSLLPESIISRFDFVSTNEGLKLLELNSDTPTFIMECFKINGHVSKHFGFEEPNQNYEKQLSAVLNKAITESIKDIKHTPNIVFTAHNDHQEDWNTTVYLASCAKVPCQLIPLSELQITKDSLIDPSGNVIDVLYRQTYPLEHLINDVDEASKDKVGIQLLHLVKRKKLVILNPISSFLLQSKAIQALIWGLAEEGSFYTKDEQKSIYQYMLPTYLDAGPFIGRMPFVKKPSFGREGDTITIHHDSQTIEKNTMQTYEDELPIYQKYVSLPTVTLETEKGLEKLSYMFGSFLLAGQPSAIGVRAGEKITGNESYFLPIGFK